MTALESRKDFKKHLASLQARREKRGIVKNKLTTKAEYEAALAATRQFPRNRGKDHPHAQLHPVRGRGDGQCQGALLAVVGGRAVEESKLNRAIQSRRRDGGSLFKPFVYATFFSAGQFRSDTRISDDRAHGEIARAQLVPPTRTAPTRQTRLPSASFFPQHHVRAHRQPGRAGQRHQSAELAGFHGNVSKTPALFLGTWEASPWTWRAPTVCLPAAACAHAASSTTLRIPRTATLCHYQEQARRLFPARGQYHPPPFSSRSASPGGTAGRIPALGFRRRAEARQALRTITRTPGLQATPPT